MKRQYMLAKLIKLYFKVIAMLENYISSIVLLLTRLWLARCFFYSGLEGATSWKDTVYLFKYEFKVPIISPTIAAFLATAAEIFCPVLLIIGIFSRFGAALPLLFMTIIIELTYIDNRENYYWALLLLTIITMGPGKISLDYLIRKRFEIKEM